MALHPTRYRASTIAANAVAPNVFFSTAPQRIGLARQRFFDEGVRPSGLVSDAVIQSWTRCAQADRGVAESISFTPVTRSRIDSAVARNRLLLEAGHEELQQLQTLLAGTGCKAILTDANCVVVHSTHTEREDGALMWLAGRVGVDLSEDCVGTTAPGMVALSGRGCTVQGAEHYFQVNHALQCAAAPIRDRRGELVAVLDLSCEARDFQFDAAALAHLYATSIENRLLTRQSKPQVLLRFQASAQLLHTPLEGLAAVDDSGQLLWMNAAGRSLLQAPAVGPGRQLGRAGLRADAGAVGDCRARRHAADASPAQRPAAVPAGADRPAPQRTRRCRCRHRLQPSARSRRPRLPQPAPTTVPGCARPASI